MIRNIVSEFVGMLIILYIGDGVVSNHLLSKNNAKGLGVLAIDLGWFAAVALPAMMFINVSGAYLNPAVTLAFVLRGMLDIQTAVIYILAQIAGAFVGSYLVYLTFLAQFRGTEDQGIKLNCFTTRPAVYDVKANILTELIGTTFLIYGVFEIVNWDMSTYLKAFFIGFLVFGLAVCMGGPTGASINPARDLGPRIAHTIMPVCGKGSSEWHYGWRPVTGQFIASFVAVGLYNLIHMAI